MLSDLPKVTQLVSSKARVKFPAAWAYVCAEAQVFLCLSLVINPWELLESKPESKGVRAALPNAELPLQCVGNNKGLNMEFN